MGRVFGDMVVGIVVFGDLDPSLVSAIVVPEIVLRRC